MRAALAPRRSLKIVQGDMLPEKLPHWNLVVARDGDEELVRRLMVPVRVRSAFGDYAA
jgi:hypothetical protein